MVNVLLLLRLLLVLLMVDDAASGVPGPAEGIQGWRCQVSYAPPIRDLMQAHTHLGGGRRCLQGLLLLRTADRIKPVERCACVLC